MICVSIWEIDLFLLNNNSQDLVSLRNFWMDSWKLVLPVRLACLLLKSSLFLCFFDVFFITGKILVEIAPLNLSIKMLLTSRLRLSFTVCKLYNLFFVCLSYQHVDLEVLVKSIHQCQIVFKPLVIFYNLSVILLCFFFFHFFCFVC